MGIGDELRERSKKFAIRIVRLYQDLPKTTAAQVLGKQVLRSGTFVAANYRATCRGRSRAEFVARLGVVVEEIDETVFWLEMLVDCEIVAAPKMESILSEARELAAILSSSQHTVRSRR